MYWNEIKLGQYNIEERWIGLDYKELFLDPILADITLTHEASHYFTAIQTDFGQATNIIFRLKDALTKISKSQVSYLLWLLFKAQENVQEGFATFREVSRLRNLTTNEYALNYANNSLPEKYKQYLSPLNFAFDFSDEDRNAFLSKVNWLAMETGIRKALKEENLLTDLIKFENYLVDSNNNPNARLLRLCNTLKNNPSLLRNDNRTIALASNIIYFEPAIKEEVASFLNYVTSFTNNPQNFSAENIGDPLLSEDVLKRMSENMIIANLNLKFAEKSTVFFNIDEFLTNVNDIEVIFLTIHDKSWEYTDLVEYMENEKPEISIAAFNKNGESFLTITSKNRAEKILNVELRDVTILVKWGGFDPIKNKFTWSKKARIPELVIYNTIRNFQERINQILKVKPNSTFSHMHLAANENHPFNTLFLKVNNSLPLHVVNCYGNKEIIETLKLLDNHTRVITNEEMIQNKKHLNNLFSIWMNMPWDINWVETIIDGKTIKYRY
jgi:hypothetical protein